MLLIIITAIIPYFIYGAIGGNIVGLLDNKKRFGFWGDTFIGAFGGFAIGYILNLAGDLIPAISHTMNIALSSSMSITNGLSILLSFIISIIPGGIAVYIADHIKKL
ncbi:MAG: hypothetical protein WCO35_00690 [Candidatus Nomurabacteria bacterium]